MPGWAAAELAANEIWQVEVGPGSRRRAHTYASDEASQAPPAPFAEHGSTDLPHTQPPAQKKPKMTEAFLVASLSHVVLWGRV